MKVTVGVPTVFRGITAINVDAKGRIALPVRYREELAAEADSKVVLTIDTEQHCLLMYPLPTWEEIEQKIIALPSFHPATRRIQRLLIGHASEQVMDAHGRILVAPLLRHYAAIGKHVVLVGQGNKFEIWDDSLWNRSRDEWIMSESSKTEELPEELKTISL